ncbi:putative metallopeptidase [Sinorhizobium medicae]|uniref:putative metallopeptidase n=1 Tax=Sinorhizobium medicae TaxID=110321 RepID=UPI00396A8D75
MGADLQSRALAGLTQGSGRRLLESTGRPVFTIRGHDVEDFVGVVRRYGADAAGVRAIVDAANRPPEIARAQIAHACGTCQLRLA